jgi:TetR/AcrR family transcriptional regulator, transcriptional repressor for nem operon
MPAQETPTARDKLVQAGTDLFRRQGYTATTVDEICQQAGLTKGAFFHHFASKEALALACLEAWDGMVAGLEERAGFQAASDPVKRAIGYMDFFIGAFANPQVLKSCLAGTTVQEVADTHPKLRDAAHACFVSGQARLEKILAAAAKASGRRVNAASLARLWITTMQGALILCKASQDESVITDSLTHVKQYIVERLTGR